MSSDTKLNKYLAKLKNTRDSKKAQVYIKKILRYKHMKKSNMHGGGIDEVNEVTAKLEKINEDLDANIANGENFTESIMNEIKMPDEVTKDSLEEALSPAMSSMNSLLQQISSLESKVPSIQEMLDQFNNKASELLIQKTSEDIKNNVGKLSENIFNAK